MMSAFTTGYRKCASLLVVASLVLLGGCRHSENRAVPSVTCSYESGRLLPLLQAVENDIRNQGGDIAPDKSIFARDAVDSLSVRFVRKSAGVDFKQPAAAQSLLSFLFDSSGIRFDTSRNNIDNLFPSSVAVQKSGSCLGIALLILSMAERCGMPLFGVLVPGHIFVRFDNGEERLNFETMKKGASMPDSWYVERFGVLKDAGCYLKNLSNEGLAAALYYNIGNIFLMRREFGKSIVYFKRAKTVLPGFVEAQGNYAIALAEEGKVDSALEILADLKNRHPDFRGIDGTMGTMALKKGDFKKASYHFGVALEKEPGNAALLFGAGITCFGMRRFPEAERYLRSAIEVRPDYPEALQALETAVAAQKRKDR